MTLLPYMKSTYLIFDSSHVLISLPYSPVALASTSVITPLPSHIKTPKTLFCASFIEPSSPIPILNFPPA